MGDFDLGGGFDLFGGDSGGSSLSTGDFNLGDSGLGDVASSLQSSDFSIPSMTGGGGTPSVTYGGGADVLGNYGGGAGGGPYSPNQTIAGPGGGDTGSTDFMGSLGKVASNILPVAQVGLAGLGAAQGVMGMRQAGDQGRAGQQAQRNQAEIIQEQRNMANAQRGMADTATARSNPLFQSGEDAILRANRGEINPAAMQRIQNWVTGAKQAARAQAASRGQGQSTTLTQWESWIDQQAQAMIAAQIEGDQKFGLSAAGAGTNVLGVGSNALSGAGLGLASAANQSGNAAQVAYQQENQLNSLIQSANQTLARLNARG